MISLRRIVTAILFFSLLLSLFACKKDGSVSPVQSPAPELPDGFSSAATPREGGLNTVSGNLYSLASQKEGDVMRVDISFMVGSSVSGTAQTEARGVPSFSCTLLANPQRLRLSFPSLDYADYSRRANLSALSKILEGTFDISVAGSTTFDFYFQFNCNIAYKLSSEYNVLSLYIIRSPVQPAENEFSPLVTANAYSEQTSGALDISADFTPTLTRTEGKILYVSRTTGTDAEAAELLNSLKAKYPLISAKLMLTALYTNDLPIYDASLDYIPVTSATPVRISGAATSLTPVLTDGLFIADTPTGGILYARTTRTADSEYQELWTLEDDTDARLFRYQFDNIESAEYASDGVRLAVLENSASGSHLYVFSLTTKELIIDLGDNIFGKRISAFLWNKLGTAIYAIGGSDSIQLCMYDFSIPDESNRKSVILDSVIDESSLELYDGTLYYVYTAEDTSNIYGIRPEGGAKRSFAAGSAFAFSPNGRYVAITTANMFSTQNDGCSLRVINLQSGVESVVTTEFAVYDFKWSADSSMLYYIEDTLSDSGIDSAEGEPQTDDITTVPATAALPTAPVDPYPYTLHSFTVSSLTDAVVCDMAQLSFKISHANGSSLYLLYSTTESGCAINATYALN